MKSQHYLLVLGLITVALVANLQAAGLETSYEMTWSGYSGYLDEPITSSESVSFTINGEKFEALAGHEKLLQFAQVKDARLTVKIPDEVDMRRLRFFFLRKVLGLLVRKRIPVTYYYRGERCDVRTFWYVRPPPDAVSDFEDTEFFLDGKSIGKSEQAQKKVSKIQWGKWPRLQVMLFELDDYPFRTFTAEASAQYPNGATRQKLDASSVVVETILERTIR